MESVLQTIEALGEQHGQCAALLGERCSGEYFPCDVLAISILNRSLDLSNGFAVVARALLYSSGVCLLRVQLDSVLRFNGVANSRDPHGVANLIFNGVKLSSVKDAAGKKMNDARLVEKLAERNPWVTDVYALCCAHIHLSDQHIHHFLSRAEATDGDERDLYIGAGSGHIDPTRFLQLHQAFLTATNGVLTLVQKWAEARARAAPFEVLRARFRAAV